MLGHAGRDAEFTAWTELGTDEVGFPVVIECGPTAAHKDDRLFKLCPERAASIDTLIARHGKELYAEGNRSDFSVSESDTRPSCPPVVSRVLARAYGGLFQCGSAGCVFGSVHILRYSDGSYAMDSSDMDM